MAEATKKTQEENAKETFKKFGKQETKEFEINGKKINVTYNYPGTLKAQQIMDALYATGSQLSHSNFYYQMFEKGVIVSPRIDWKYFDDQLKDEQKSKTFEIENEDGTKDGYVFKFPGYRLAQVIDDLKHDINGKPQTTEAYSGLMEEVVTTANGNKINWEYWDTHHKMDDVLSEALTFINELLEMNGYFELLNYADRFLTEMHNK